MRNILYSLILLAIVSCKSEPEIKFTVYNNTDTYQPDEIVEIPVTDFSSKLIRKDTSMVYIVRNERGVEIPSQVTYDGKLIFLTNQEPSEKASYTISLSEKMQVESKVFGRFYPERKGDFAWENDRVGFRFYGDSLRYTDGSSNALDIWLKRTDKLVLDKWYYNDLVNKISYHQDHGEGCDPYAVGRTLGAGNIAPFVKDSLYLNNNYLSYEILDKGPLRFTFKLDFPSMMIDGKNIQESKVISLDAGSQMTKIEQYFSFSTVTPVAVGIVKRQSGDSIIVSKPYNTLLYQEPSMGDNGLLFVGVIVPTGIIKDTIYTYDYVNPINKKTSSFTNVLAVTDYNPDKTFVYYAGFGWSKFGFENSEDFNKYIQNYSKRLQNPLTVKFD